MKRPMVRAGLVLAAGVLLGIGASAQVYPGGNPYNPYTGKPVPQAPYNPMTGAGGPPQGPNPFTGQQSPGGPAVNPYTGKPMGQPATYNPLAGNYQPDKPMAMPTASQVYQWPKGKYPMTGKAGPGLEPLDDAVQTIMTRHGIPGAALAIAKDGKLVYARGFGWADLTAAIAVAPLTLFGLASLSKPFTALAILFLIDQGQLSLDDRAFEVLKYIKPLPGTKVDPRLKDITIRQLLNHTGGWDRDKSGDPSMMGPQIANLLGVPSPPNDEQLISYLMSQPLDYDPGTEEHYSNLGFIILGRVVAKVSGQPYEDFVRQKILEPAGVKQQFISKGHRSYKQGEARRYLAGTSIMLPPMDMPMVQAAGGWTSSAVDVVRFLTMVDGSRVKSVLKDKTFKQMLAPPPPPLKAHADGTHNGLGWPTVFLSKDAFGYMHAGSFDGMRTFMKRSSKGVNWALLFNVSMQPDQLDDKIAAQALHQIRENVESLKEYPKIDLFSEFP